ncbi:MAG: insulinase family protein [Fusobacteriaceae bacterium]
MKILFLFYLLLISNITTFAQDEILRGKLPNGLSYYIMKNSKPEKKASLNLVIKSGSLNENEDQRGLAHFLEHMAFNGTSEYPKNELIKYLQSAGLSFGGDLNAHTGYDETVYKLQIPTDSDKSLEEGFHVLRQWATEITLNPADIQEEKNIIMEEWRTAQGLTERLGKVRREALFGDSRFFHRSPIGVPKTIESANEKLLKDYYEKWYHPELMSVIAVGDFDTDKIESIIAKEFSYSPKQNLETKVEYSLPETKSSVKVFSDSELLSSTLELFSKGDYLSGNSEENNLKNLKYLIFSNILNSRLSILEKRKNTAFSKAFHYWYPLGKNTSVEGVRIIAKENQIPASLKEIMENIQSLALYPVSQEELSRELEELSTNLKNRETNRTSIENERFISEIRDEFILGDIFISPKDSYHLFEKLKPGVTSEEIQKIAQNFFNKNFALLVSHPEKDGVSPLDNKSLDKIIQDVKSLPGKNLFSENKNNFKAVKLKPGKILQEKTLPEYTFFQLSNGIEVLYKETDFDKDRINMLLFKEEGSSILDYTGYINSLFLGELLQKSGVGGLDKEEYELFLKGKNYDISPYISDYDHGFNIYSDRKNLTSSMDTFTTLLLEKKLDSDILENRLNLNMERSRNLKNSPRMVFSEKMKALLSGDNPRRKTPNEKDFSLVSMPNVEVVSQKLFSDFSGYKLIVTGSVDSHTLKNILTKYISALPGSLQKKDDFSIGNIGIKQPTKSIKERVSQGEDAKATVTIHYPYQDIYSNKNRILFSAYSKILDIVLIDKIREEMSGVYSIRSADSLRYENHGENTLTISYSSSPESALKISGAVQDIIRESLEGKYIQENLEKIYENYRLTYGDEIKRNRFWFYYLKNRALKNRDYGVLTPEEYRKFVTYENLLEFLPKALSPDIFVEGLLLPETREAP